MQLFSNDLFVLGSRADYVRMMKIALLIVVLLIVVALAAYFLFFPRDADFIIFSKPGGGSVALSRTSVSFEAAPDHYAMNGFDHIDPYVTRLLVPTNKFKFLNFFTPDGISPTEALDISYRDK